MTVIDSDEAFAVWLDHMQPALAGFKDFGMPAEWTGGYTRESLVELEAFLLDQWPDSAAFAATADPVFVDGAGRYLGETYLRVVGGGWEILTASGGLYSQRPILMTDVMEGVPIAPYVLLNAVVHRRTGAELSRVYDNMVRRVGAKKAELGADWKPQRLAVPGVTEGTEAEEDGSPDAREWAARVDERIAALQSRLGGARGSLLDLSPSSLKVVEGAALDDFATEDIDVNAPSDLVQQYVAYVGATLLEAAGGRWILRPGEPSENMFLGNPYVYREDKGGDPRPAAPVFTLRRLVTSRQSGVLSDALTEFAKEY